MLKLTPAMAPLRWHTSNHLKNHYHVQLSFGAKFPYAWPVAARTPGQNQVDNHPHPQPHHVSNKGGCLVLFTFC